MNKLLEVVLSITLFVISVTPSFAQAVSAGRQVVKGMVQSGAKSAGTTAGKQALATMAKEAAAAGAVNAFSSSLRLPAAPVRPAAKPSSLSTPQLRLAVDRSIQQQLALTGNDIRAFVKAGQTEGMASRILSHENPAFREGLLRNEFVTVALKGGATAEQISQAVQFYRRDLNKYAASFAQIPQTDLASVLKVVRNNKDASYTAVLNSHRALSSAAALGLLGSKADATVLLDFYKQASQSVFKDTAAVIAARGLLRQGAYKELESLALLTGAQGPFWQDLAALVQEKGLSVTIEPKAASAVAAQPAELSLFLRAGCEPNALNADLSRQATEKWLAFSTEKRLGAAAAQQPQLAEPAALKVELPKLIVPEADLNLDPIHLNGGSAAPAIELVYIFCQKLGVEVEVNMEAVGRIRTVLKDVRKSLKDFDLQKAFPNDFDPLKDTLPADVDALFDKAIAAAKANDEAALLDACHAIEAYFNFPKPNEIVKNAEVPGGMYSNMVAQLKQLQAEDVLEDAMKLIPKVRRDAGLVPLVTPTSQIVGSQAVVLALDRKKGNADYTNKSNQFISLVRGEYGHTPVPIDPEFRRLITGKAEEVPYNVNSYVFPENPELPECGGAKLAVNDEEYLLLELLPMVAKPFLQKRRAAEYEATKKQAAPAVAKEEKAAPAGDEQPITGRVLCAPMGGTIVELHVKPGDAVKEGTPVLMYEAMKMQSELEAEFADTVKRILVAPGDVVHAGQPLVEFATETAAKASEAAPEPEPETAEVTGPTLDAPMGGTIIEIHVKPGDAVKEGTPVLMYEAMKMQSELEAEFSGTVKRILVEPGQVIRTGEHLVEFEKK